MKYCKKCTAENDDMNVYCCKCGSLLDEKNSNYANTPDPDNGPYQQNFNSSQNAYDSNEHQYHNDHQSNDARYYQSPGYEQRYQPMPDPGIKKGKVIAGLVLAILFGGIIGIVFGIVGLLSYSDYESAVARGDAMTAKQKCLKIKKCNTGAWICAILGLIFSIIVSGIAILGFRYYEDDTMHENGFIFEDGDFSPFFNNDDDIFDFEGADNLRQDAPLFDFADGEVNA